MTLRSLLFLSVSAACAVVTEAAEAALPLLLKKANEARFEVGKKAAFLGVFAPIEAAPDLRGKLVRLKETMTQNPFIVGVTLRIQWQQFHPEADKVDFEGLDALVETAATAGKLVTIALIPGGASPEWIYQFGVKKIGPVRCGAHMVTAPVPWDYRYLEIYWGDLRRLQAKYGADPRVWAVAVLGHNFDPLGGEMHAPPPEALRAMGWSKHTVLENWKIWIDLHDELFPTKKLILVVSEGYPGNDDLVEGVARYFVERCQGRAILMSHQLHGRYDELPFGPSLGRKLAGLAPGAHELAASLEANPGRQGSLPMTVFNAVQSGPPVFLQLQPGDCADPRHVKALLNAWNRYGWIPASNLKSVLEEDGHWVPKK